jgi:hypothetical protein
MKITTLLPTHYNDGKPLPDRILRRFMDYLSSKFGGCSDEGKTLGQWIDPASSIKHEDESKRITVVCDRIMLGTARAAVIRIGRRLHQRAMYFEVRDYDGVQILEVPFRD